MLEKVVNLAEKQIGTVEQPPHSNRTIFGEAYGANGVPWCVIFIWWLFCVLKLARLFYGGKRCASCSQLLEWAKETGQTVKPAEAQRGDVLFFNFDRGSTPEHCGLCKERTGTFVQSIEGNTPLQDADNDGVALKTRQLSRIVAVWRPKYDNSTDYDGRWSYQAIRDALEDGALTGYPDGSFKPDRPVTREELAQFYVNIKKLGRVK